MQGHSLTHLKQHEKRSSHRLVVVELAKVVFSRRRHHVNHLQVRRVKSCNRLNKRYELVDLASYVLRQHTQWVQQQYTNVVF